MNHKIGIIDVFAGPGGLGEGFSSFESKPGVRPFQISVSAEMEQSAHATLRLRAFFRLLESDGATLPQPYSEYLERVAMGVKIPPAEHFGVGRWAKLWKQADAEALNLTLGDPSHNALLYQRIAAAKKQYGALVLIGGPPCQAYSLVGRARKTHFPGFHTVGEDKHFLYKEYLQILARFSPDMFIMENVKGILSSSVGGRNMFSRIRSDLARPRQAVGLAEGKSENPEYVLLPIHVSEGEQRDPSEVERDPSRLIIRCEQHGIPQARHRVIVMGVRVNSDMVGKALKAPVLARNKSVSVASALAGLPRLRSGLSRTLDDGERWAQEADSQRTHVMRAVSRTYPWMQQALEAAHFDSSLPRRSNRYSGRSSAFSASLRRSDQELVTGHEARGHMAGDLGRYLFAAAYAAEKGRSPSSAEFPPALAPDHINWFSGDFADRFRVQIKSQPANTVTSHLSKDGHAFIHWDLDQCRSLSPREAARIQTFPDDYIFLGNRTEQFVQVGNAVPPFLARQIAGIVWSVLK